ncbi:MAG: hypothetical protein HC914_10510 [Chloroflexaceae bacterium]|nr:hypothetical protein [Chloroflexaceae bacterium]
MTEEHAELNLDAETAELATKGVEALEAGSITTARLLLTEVTNRVPEYQDAWLWLSDIAETDTERIGYLQQAVAISPETRAGQVARQRLEQLGVLQEPYAQPRDNDLPPIRGEEEDTSPTPWWQRVPPWMLILIGATTTVLLVLLGVLLFQTLGGTAGNGGTTTPTPSADNQPLLISAGEVVSRLQAAGLEVTNPRPAVVEDYGTVPPRCIDSSQRFFIPSLGDPAGGIVVVCQSIEEAQALQADYDAQGTASRTFRNRNVLIQVDGRITDQQASQYQVVVEALASGAAVPTLAPNQPPTATPLPISAIDVYNRLFTAGVEVAEPRPAVPEDFGTVPPRCIQNGQRFFVPSLGGAAGGVIVTCPNAAEAQALQNDYAVLGSASRTFSNNNVLVQVDGRISDQQARQIEAVIARWQPGSRYHRSSLPPVRPNQRRCRLLRSIL